MSSYSMFGPSSFSLPIKPLEFPIPDSKNDNEFLDRMIMEGKINPAVQNFAEKEIVQKIEKCCPSSLIPESEEKVITLTEKLFVPIIPGYNFVGRLLGPGGSHVQRLQEATGCTIQVRGRGTLKDREREEFLKNMLGWEHLKEDLYVIIQCEDKEQRCRQKMVKARHHVKSLFLPMENDEVKHRQLMEVALLNGTFRPLPNQPIPPLTRPPPVIHRPSLVALRFVE